MNEKQCFTDEAWQQMYEALSQYARRYGHCYVTAVEENLFDWCRRQRNHRRLLHQSQVAALDSLGFDWHTTGGFLHQRWEAMYEQLKSYQQVHGHCRVSAPEHASLAKWVSRQRSQEATLSEYRKAKLNAIGFTWSEGMRKLDAQHYETRFAELEAFAQQHGHCRVPKTPNKSLHIWVAHQRINWSCLSKEWQQCFLAIGFEPHPHQAFLLKWQQMATRLQAYVQEYGHAKVPKDWALDIELASWVARQRTYAFRISAEQKKQLDDLGFLWKSDIKKAKKERWEQRYRELEAFRNEHGHCRVPDQYKLNPALGSWVSIQREKKDQLPSHRRDRLDALDFAWREDIREQAHKQWFRMLGKLKSFLKEYGHCRVPEGWPESPQLAIWVAMHRQNKYRLPEWKRAKLDAIGFIWSEQLKKERIQGWEGRFEQLVQFKQANGHCRVTLKKCSDAKFFRWVEKQRRFPERLTTQQRFRLNELGLPWPKTRLEAQQAKWDMHYQELVAYQQRFGHCRVPEGWEENPKLAGWVGWQRRLEESMAPERRAKLQMLGFTWKDQIQQEKAQEWQSMLEKLKVYQAIHRHCRVPATYSADPALGHWVFRQRSRGEALTRERKEQLDSLDFEWKVGKGSLPAKMLKNGID